MTQAADRPKAVAIDRLILHKKQAALFCDAPSSYQYGAQYKYLSYCYCYG